MGKNLWTEGMTDSQLWSVLQRNLRWLKDARVGELNMHERRGLAKTAAECAAELHLRGTQLSLGDTPWNR
jgi:hypothetical protein